MRGLKEPSVPGGNQAPPLPPPPDHQKCPRCESFSTKFCYYNNYSITQPRYFCRECRRYWTQGGTLRNVPHGGRCLKARLISKLPSSPTYVLSKSYIKPAAANPQSVIPPQQEVLQQGSTGSGGGGEGGGGNPGQGFAESLNQSVPINGNGEIVMGSSSSSDLGLLQGFDDLCSFNTTPPIHNQGEFNVGNQTNMASPTTSFNDQEYNWHGQSFNNINNSPTNVVMATEGGYWNSNPHNNNNNGHESSLNSTSTASYWYEVLEFGNTTPSPFPPSTPQPFF